MAGEEDAGRKKAGFTCCVGSCVNYTYSLKCVSLFAAAGDNHIWSTDDLLPAFTYVTVRAQIQHLGAEIRFIKDFAPYLQNSGQLEPMFTTLMASYCQICNDKSMP
ncbi:unnamed protein product [Thelazia callipaeda]|uniref:VPS9 domain-containing protein n=1 Tax=Thelazia callipaeda TaxID=103827 RepID=A0A0N5CLP7_THECL|nr:unnamed protein product [Thelazia callipaeda]